jgi:hypothetical protein
MMLFSMRVFPFAELHSNVGARLRSEILLLPKHLLKFLRDGTVPDHMPDSHTVTTNDLPSCAEKFESNGGLVPPLPSYFM